MYDIKKFRLPPSVKDNAASLASWFHYGAAYDLKI